MSVEIIMTSDFLCPWCYLGKARLDKALQALGPDLRAQQLWRPFELNPDMPSEGMSRKTYRARKFGWERSLQMDAQLTALGEREGVTFNFPLIERASNTRLAHRLTLFATHHDLADEYCQAVFQAYFEAGRDIGSREVLLGIVRKVGLDPESAAVFLAGDGALEEVRRAEADAYRQGIQGVPHFQIGRHSISGAQDTSVFISALRDAESGQASTDV